MYTAHRLRPGGSEATAATQGAALRAGNLSPRRSTSRSFRDHSRSPNEQSDKTRARVPPGAGKAEKDEHSDRAKRLSRESHRRRYCPGQKSTATERVGSQRAQSDQQALLFEERAGATA